MLTVESARELYEHDPEFRALVISMETAIERLQFTPSELRAAAVYAAIRREERRNPRLRLHPDGRLEEECERCGEFFPRGAEHKCGANRPPEEQAHHCRTCGAWFPAGENHRCNTRGVPLAGGPRYAFDPATGRSPTDRPGAWAGTQAGEVRRLATEEVGLPPVEPGRAAWAGTVAAVSEEELTIETEESPDAPA